MPCFFMLRIYVSIHAPAWGATHHLKVVIIFWEFQSTLPHGERLTVARNAIWSKMFQSTLPHGERLLKTTWGLHQGLFQSTLPHGERLHAIRPIAARDMFQSTLPHGERRQTICHPAYHYRVSIHAPAWGATSSFKSS